MAALAFAVHTLGAVVWVGGMFAIYVYLRPALSTLEPPQGPWRAFRSSRCANTAPTAGSLPAPC
jgi:putative copper export protein